MFPQPLVESSHISLEIAGRLAAMSPYNCSQLGRDEKPYASRLPWRAATHVLARARLSSGIAALPRRQRYRVLSHQQHAGGLLSARRSTNSRRSVASWARLPGFETG